MTTKCARQALPFGAAMIVAAIGLILGGCQSGSKAPEPPAFAREMRGVWVTTFENGSWPSRSRLAKEDQIKEIDATIERCKELKINTIILQVRAKANAIYPSTHEPWAAVLTGTRGKSPGYDPLDEWVKRAHANGMELHAWMIPFLAYNDPPGTFKGKHTPRLVRHGRYDYFDPADPETRNYLLEVYGEVLVNYDIDAIAFEHYIYPPTTQPTTQASPIMAPTTEDASAPTAMVEFNDVDEYATYQKGGGKLSRADWRRQNASDFVVALRKLIQSKKPWVRLGISPFGIPSPSTPDFLKGAAYLDQYRVTCADPELWLRNGWVDYLVPELYWMSGSAHFPFLGLLQFWVDPRTNPKGRNIYAGLYTSKVWLKDGWPASEITGQVMDTRFTPGAGGAVHFSVRPLTENSKNIADLLAKGAYANGALPPASPWLGKKAPPAPTHLNYDRLGAKEVQDDLPERVIKPPFAWRPTDKPATRPFVMLTAPSKSDAAKEAALGGVKVSWDPPASDSVWRWAVYSRHGDTWKLQVVGRGISTGKQPIHVIIRDDPRNGPANAIAVSAVDRLGNESARTKLELKN